MRSLGLSLLLALLAAPIFGGEYLDELRHAARRQNLARHPEWRALLHMKPGRFGGEKSQADGRGFFLSPKGKTDAQAELDATLAAFFAPVEKSTEAVHPQSAFPARYAWLNGKLHFDDRLPRVESPRWAAWRDKIDADAVSLVFASAYLNNPASMFGHTFLRLHRRGRAGLDPLLDYTANFAAVTNTRAGVNFAIQGLLGGYPGRFSTVPYYMKTQQYTNQENRELWEYDLRLSPAQTARLRDHLWELGNTEFDYFFLTENCSYQLLPLLEVADPARRLSEGFRYKAIPVDTMRAILASPEFVTATRVRPARVQVVLARRARLSIPERTWVERTQKAADQERLAGVGDFPADRRGPLLDSTYDLFRLRRKFKRYGEPADEAFEAALLKARSAYPAEPEISTAVIGGFNPPEVGHPTGLLGLSGGAGRGYVFEELELRPALHELTDPGEGYPPGSQLHMFRVKARYYNQPGHAALEQASLVDIVSLSPWDAWTRTPSWKFFLGWERARNLGGGPERGTHFTANGGSGLTWKLPGEGLLYARIDADAGLGGIFDQNARLGAGGSAGLLFASSARWRLQGEAGLRRYFWGDLDTVTRWALVNNLSLTKLWTLRAEWSRQGRNREALLGLNRFL